MSQNQSRNTQRLKTQLTSRAVILFFPSQSSSKFSKASRFSIFYGKA